MRTLVELMVADNEVRMFHLRDEMRVTALLRDSYALADQARVHVGDRRPGGRNNRVGERCETTAG